MLFRSLPPRSYSKGEKQMPETAGHLKRSVKTVSSWTLDRVSRVFGPWVDMPENCGAGKRTRLFSPSVTFWLFLLQVLDEKGSCREALRRFHAWLSFIEGKTASASTAAYCKARARLQPVKLAETNEKIVTKIGKACPWLWHSRSEERRVGKECRSRWSP